MSAKASVIPTKLPATHGLPKVARHCNRNQVEAADAAFGRIERDPTRTGHINLRPGVGGTRTKTAQAVLVGIIEIARYDRAPKPSVRAAFGEHTVKSRHEPQPRSSVSSGPCVPSSSRTLIADPLEMPSLRSLSSDSVSMGLLRMKPRAQSRSRPCGSRYCGAASAPRSVHSSSA